MDIIFERKRMRDEFNSEQKLVKIYGKVRARRIMMRMNQLAAARCLADLQFAPGRFHSLTGNREGQIACDLDHPYRLIFESAEEPRPVLADGKGLDWQRVTRIKVLGIEDYH